MKKYGCAPGHHFQKQYQWQKWQLFPYQTYEGFVAYSDSTVDKVNFVIFVITPLLLELQVDKTTRVRLPAFFKSAFFECFFEAAGCPWLVTVLPAPMFKL